MAEKLLTEEEKAQIEALGGFDKLMETLRQRLEEQKGRHQGGTKWIGTAGTSPFGAYGYNPEGVRIGQDESRHRRAVKVWDKREFRDLDDDVELGTRNIKLALRRLRRFARQGAATELDMPGTIRATAHNAGWLDLKMVPERHNAVKVLLLLDIGGSMDDHVRALRGAVLGGTRRVQASGAFLLPQLPLRAGLAGQPPPARDADPDRRSCCAPMAPTTASSSSATLRMSPYEIIQPGGSVEHWNDEPGQVWLHRLTGHFRRTAWLNPSREMGRRAIDRHDAPADGGPDVSADAGRVGGDDAGVQPVTVGDAPRAWRKRSARPARKLAPARLARACPRAPGAQACRCTTCRRCATRTPGSGRRCGRELVRQDVTEAPETLDFERKPVQGEIEPDALFTQVCGWPLQMIYAGQAVVLGVPIYARRPLRRAPRMPASSWRAGRPAYASVADLRGCDFVFNSVHSNSGMNLPRRAIARLWPEARPFFGSVREALRPARQSRAGGATGGRTRPASIA